LLKKETRRKEPSLRRVGILVLVLVVFLVFLTVVVTLVLLILLVVFVLSLVIFLVHNSSPHLFFLTSSMSELSFSQMFFTYSIYPLEIL